MIEVYCDLCDEEKPCEKQPDSLWVCMDCEEAYPQPSEEILKSPVGVGFAQKDSKRRK